MTGDVPDSALFKEFKLNESKESNYAELSINWYDNENSLNQIMDQKDEKGEKIYKIGAAILSRIELDKLCKRHPTFAKHVKYERDPIEDANEHHGNILIEKDLVLSKSHKKTRDIIAAGIAVSCYVGLVAAGV